MRDLQYPSSLFDILSLAVSQSFLRTSNPPNSVAFFDAEGPATVLDFLNDSDEDGSEIAILTS